MSSPLFDLHGRVAIVTGASRGIGRAVGETLAACGAKVVVSSRRLVACEEVAAGIRGNGGEAMAVACHIGKREEIDALVHQVHAQWGPVGILVCNAAVNPYMGPMDATPAEAFSKTMDYNVWGALQFALAVKPDMVGLGGGAVIFVASISALSASPMTGTYAISKAADMQLARNLAVEWGQQNIRVNCIAPGLVKTEMSRAVWENEAGVADVVRQTPLKRIANPVDVAGVAAFLATPAAGFVTGQTLVVDGGAMIWPRS